MPRPRAPARLYFREKTGFWVIKDGPSEHGTGCRGRGSQEAAEEKLAAHIAARLPERTGPAQPSEIKVGEVLARYILDKAEEIVDTARLEHAARALSPFWADRTCDAVKGSTCRAYATWRSKPVTRTLCGPKGKDYTRTTTASTATIRRELGVLQAALNHGLVEGILVYAPKVALTAKGDAREGWLTRDQAAAMIRAARKMKHRGLARFVLIGCYTGTRPSAILALRTTPSLTAGYGDLERGILHRRGGAERETNKRRGSCRLPRPLLAHMRRWARAGESHYVMSPRRRGPIRDIGQAWSTAAKMAGIEGVTPHVVKKTAVTWFFQRGGSIEDGTDFFATSAKTLEASYRQHSPRYQERAADIMGRKA